MPRRAAPARSDPTWGWEQEAPVTMGACSIFVVKDGKILAFSDYG